MNANPCDHIRPRTGFCSLLCLLVSFSTLHAFFPRPDPLRLLVGTSGVVEVHGSSPAAAVSLQNITIAPNNGGITHDFAGARNGTGFVKVNFTGVAPGNYVVTFSGKNNGSNVQGSITVIVGTPPITAASNEFHLTVADPVNSRTGEYYGVEAVDLSLGGPMPLGFSRYYASALVADGVAAGALGANRLHNFDARITVELLNRRVAVRTNRGRMVIFEKPFDGKKWTQVGRKDRVFGLMEEEGIFYFFSPAEQGVWVFDNTGRLTSITDGRGNTHTLTYAGAQLASVADGLGRVLTFTHTSGRITRVTDHTGRHVDFAYAGSNLATAADAAAKVTAYSYDGAGLLTSFTRPEGNVPFTQVFTAGKVTSQTERGTDTTTMNYGANSTTITQPGGATMTHTYAPSGELTSYTDEGGKTVTTTSDATGRRSGVADRTGDATGITYHAPSGLPEKITNAQGGASTMTYKARVLKLPGVTDAAKALTFFDLVKVTFPDGSNESFTYDSNGNMLSRTDRAGKKWTSTFNGRGQPLTMMNPNGGVTTMTYDAAGNLASSKDSATGATNYAYDLLSRLTNITPPEGGDFDFAYDARDLLTSFSDPAGVATSFTYDDNRRLITAAHPVTGMARIAYDALDRATQFTDRLGKMSARSFDARRLLASVTDRNGNATTFAYDERQRPTGATDAGGKTWTLGFDDESQLASAANPINPPGRIKRNAMGRVVEASNALGHTSAVVRDAMQRVTQATDPLGRVTKFSRDKRGQLIGVAEEGGGAAKFTRDALGQVTAIAAPNGGIWKTEYSKEGRIHESTDPLGATWHRTYDQSGRPATIEHPDGVTQTFTYNSARDLANIVFTGGLNFAFHYDSLHRLTNIANASGPPAAIAFSYDAESRLTNSRQDGVNFAASRDNGGRLQIVAYGDGAVVVTYTYDTRNRLTGVSDNVSGATVAFTHDDAGRVTGITRGNGVNSTHTYDDAGRLTRIQHGAVIDVKYTRNAVGEVTAEDITAPALPAAPATNDAFTFGKAGQLATTGFTYDARGRLTASPGATFTWDAASRLVNVGGFAAGYNALGEIITRNGPGGVTQYFHHHAIAGSPIVGEKANGSTTFTRYYVHTPGGMLLYAIDAAAANAVSYYHFDHLGSTLALSDGMGAITDSYAHGPFGENEQHTGTSTQPFTWLGALGVRKDGALFHMRARWYDPKTARFLSRDPLPPRLANVKSLNPYAYANNNPLRYVDPRGTFPSSGGISHLNSERLIVPLSMRSPVIGREPATFHPVEGSFSAAVNVTDTGKISGFTLIEGGCDIGDDIGGGSRTDDYCYDSHDAWPNVMVQVLDLDGIRSGSSGNRTVEAMHIHGSGGSLTGSDPFDIVRDNAAKFGGVVHSSAASLVGDAGDTDASGTDLIISLGILGEYFPTQYLSLFMRAGLLIDFIGEDEACAVLPGGPLDNPSGFNINLSSPLEGNAAFTVWFK